MNHPKPMRHIALTLLLASLSSNIHLTAQGFNTLSVETIVWKSDSTPLQTISLDSQTINTISDDATGVLVFDLTGTSSITDSSGLYTDPGIEFACSLELPDGGNSEYVQIENGTAAGFAEIWHSTPAEATTLSFDPLTGAGKYRIECPLDSELEHLQFSTSSTALQTMHYWIGFAGQLGSDGTAPPTSFAISGLIKSIVAPPALQVFQPAGATIVGIPIESPSRAMVVVGTQSNQTRTLHIAASIPDYSGDPVIDGKLDITPSTISVAPAQSTVFFDITIHDDGLLFASQRMLTLTLDIDGNDITTAKLGVGTLSFPDALADATGDGFWESNRTCVYGTSGGGSSFPPPPPACDQCHEIQADVNGNPIDPPPPVGLPPIGHQVFGYTPFSCEKSFFDRCYIFNNRFQIPVFKLGPNVIRKCKYKKAYFESDGTVTYKIVTGHRWCREYSFDKLDSRVLKDCVR